MQVVQQLEKQVKHYKYYQQYDKTHRARILDHAAIEPDRLKSSSYCLWIRKLSESLSESFRSRARFDLMVPRAKDKNLILLNRWFISACLALFMSGLRNVANFGI